MQSDHGCWSGIPWGSPATQKRSSELQDLIGSPVDSAEVRWTVAELSRRHAARMARTLNLYAGSNVLSPAVAAEHRSFLQTRPALGLPGEKLQPGVEEIEALEVLATQEVARAMGATLAEVRFVTATMANLAVYSAFTDPGDTIAVLSPEAGGHSSHHGDSGTAAVRGLRVEHLPYSPDHLDLDLNLLRGFCREVLPRLILVGGSVALFPHRLEQVRTVANELDSLLVYDASHTAGLIAGGALPNPLLEGADIVTFSTYKTFGGPAGGAAVTNDAGLAGKLSAAAYPTLLSNYDPARLGPLAIAAREATDQNPAWAASTVQAAQTLALHLHELGHHVLGQARGFTASHQVVLDLGAGRDSRSAMKILEGAGVLVGTCRIPGSGPVDPPSGLRFGMQEVVRRGLPIERVPDLALLVHESLRSERSAELKARQMKIVASMPVDIWGRRSVDMQYV